MPKLSLEVRLYNESEDFHMMPETLRILDELKKKIENGATEGIIRDINGNPIGHFFIVE